MCKEVFYKLKEVLESREENKLVLEEWWEEKEGRGFLEKATLKIFVMEEF